MIAQQIRLTFLAVLRDRILHAVAGVGLLLLLVVPVFSSFSMRQVQESSVTLALAFSSLILLVIATQLGATSIFRDVDRRYVHAVLTLPQSRGQFMVARFAGLAAVLLACALILFVSSSLIILYATSTYPSPQPIVWGNVLLAYLFNACKYILLLAITFFFSSLSTSFTLPFFAGLAVYFAGSASQEVYEFILTRAGENLSPLVAESARVFYYLIPNFASFDLHVQAVYGLPLDPFQLVTTLVYGFCYTGMVVWAAVLVFKRRELP